MRLNRGVLLMQIRAKAAMRSAISAGLIAIAAVSGAGCSTLSGFRIAMAQPKESAPTSLTCLYFGQSPVFRTINCCPR